MDNGSYVCSCGLGWRGRGWRGKKDTHPGSLRTRRERPALRECLSCLLTSRRTSAFFASFTGWCGSARCAASEASLFQFRWVKSNIATATTSHITMSRNKSNSNSNNKPLPFSGKPPVFGPNWVFPPHIWGQTGAEGFLVHDFAVKGVKVRLLFFPTYKHFMLAFWRAGQKGPV